MILITIPGTPIGKGRPRMTRSGHCYTPVKTSDYEETVALFGFQGMAGRPPLQGPVRIEVEAIFPIPKSWTKKQKAEATWHTSAPDADKP